MYNCCVGDSELTLVSACLAGELCRYDGTGCPNKDIVAMVGAGSAIAACPEMLGGLSTPRARAEIRGGDGLAVLRGDASVINENGQDVTGAFLEGAARFVAVAKAANCAGAILKSKSPACGVGTIFDGAFSGTVQSGDGVAAAALKLAGIEIKSLD